MKALASPHQAKMNELVTIQDGRPVTTSFKVGEVFGKLPKNINRDIRNLECFEDFRKLNFEPTEIDVKMPTGAIRKDPGFFITRDGCSFLIMGFTGKKAAHQKETYIAEFNRMESALKVGMAVSADPEILTTASKRVLVLQNRVGSLENEIRKLTRPSTAWRDINRFFLMCEITPLQRSFKDDLYQSCREGCAILKMTPRPRNTFFQRVYAASPMVRPCTHEGRAGAEKCGRNRVNKRLSGRHNRNPRHMKAKR